MGSLRHRFPGVADGWSRFDGPAGTQVVDTAMVDGAASLMNMFWGMKAMGVWNDERGTNMLDTGSHFYDVYECSDGEYISIGSIEPQFYAELLRLSGMGEMEGLAPQNDRAQWPAMKQRVVDLFKTKTRDEWSAIMEHSDVCFAPVLSMDEATRHPHNVERGTFIEVGGMTQAAPAPRFSRTSPQVQGPASHPGADTDDVLRDYGFDADTIAKLRDVGAVA